MDYKNLIKTARLRKSTADRSEDIVSETESDKARILFSAPFRRLQKKAQVFPLESNAAVRSRLTHTLEVTTVGRQIAQKIARALSSLEDYSQKEAFINIVESACLLHDIGNPPFGHFGEAAISNWFKQKAVTSTIFKEKRAAHLNFYIDLENFDGNAQGLRTITKLQGEDQFGLNLTCSTIAAYLKYTHPEFSRTPGKNDFHKKPGYFLTEKDKIETVWKTLQIPLNTRNPLTFIMEAADDIAYCLSDIEDGIEKRVITLEKLIDEVTLKLQDKNLEEWQGIINSAESKKNHINKFIAIRTTLINRATEIAKASYIRNEELILSGAFYGSLIDKESSEYAILKAVRSFVSRFVYTSREAEIIELSGNSVINGLLEKLSPLLELAPAFLEDILNKDMEKVKENGLQIQSRLANLLPSQCIKSYRADTALDPEHEWIYRAHLIIDYISGMTDDFALETYQRLSGIKTL